MTLNPLDRITRAVLRRFDYETLPLLRIEERGEHHYCMVFPPHYVEDKAALEPVYSFIHDQLITLRGVTKIDYALYSFIQSPEQALAEGGQSAPDTERKDWQDTLATLRDRRMEDTEGRRQMALTRHLQQHYPKLAVDTIELDRANGIVRLYLSENTIPDGLEQTIQNRIGRFAARKFGLDFINPTIEIIAPEKELEVNAPSPVRKSSLSVFRSGHEMACFRTRTDQQKCDALKSALWAQFPNTISGLEVDYYGQTRHPSYHVKVELEPNAAVEARGFIKQAIKDIVAANAEDSKTPPRLDLHFRTGMIMSDINWCHSNTPIRA